MAGAKREGGGGGGGGGRKPPKTPPSPPFSLSPTPFDAYYAGYRISKEHNNFSYLSKFEPDTGIRNSFGEILFENPQNLQRMYELINLLLPSSFFSFLLLLFSLCYQLQRAETCTNCINRAVASEGGTGGKGAAALHGPVEPDKSSLLIDLFSLDSVILIIVTCNCLPFAMSIFRDISHDKC